MIFRRAAAVSAAAAIAIGSIALGWTPGAGTGARAGTNPIAELFPLIFDSEWIRLAVIGDSLEVRGMYFLLCRERIGESIPLLYPFPRDSTMGDARMVSLLVRQGSRAAPAFPGRWEELPYTSGVRWWIPPCQGDTLVAEAIYRQKISPGYARYIVTSTRGWGRPLRRAEFEIRLPLHAVPLDFSFPFERRQNGTDVFYSYTATAFFPDRDIVVRWKPSGNTGPPAMGMPR